MRPSVGASARDCKAHWTRLGVTPPRVRRPVSDCRAGGGDRRRPRQRGAAGPSGVAAGDGRGRGAGARARAGGARDRARRRGGARRGPRRRAGARRHCARRRATRACCAASRRDPPPFAPDESVPGFGARWVEASPDEPIAIPEGFTELDPEGLIEAERPRVTLDDVGGLEEVKARLDAAFLAPLRNPELRAYYGKSLRGGLLLYGPPGCGKTFLARAVAGELGARFFSLGLNDVLDMWLGESERRLHDAFEAARRAAPCVLFLDELDALGQKRSHLRHSAGATWSTSCWRSSTARRPTTRACSCSAATNHPWDVDTALRRPGRLDRTRARAPARPAGPRGDPAQRARGAPDRGRRPGQARPPHRRLLGRGPRPHRRVRLRAGAAGVDPHRARCTRSRSASSSRPRSETAPSTKAWFGDRPQLRAVRQRRPVSTTTCWPTSGRTSCCDRPKRRSSARSRCWTCVARRRRSSTCAAPLAAAPDVPSCTPDRARVAAARRLRRGAAGRPTPPSPTTPSRSGATASARDRADPARPRRTRPRRRAGGRAARARGGDHPHRARERAAGDRRRRRRGRGRPARRRARPATTPTPTPRSARSCSSRTARAEAIAAYEARAARWTPRTPTALNNLAVARLRAHQRAGIGEQFEAAARLDPRLDVARHNILHTGPAGRSYVYRRVSIGRARSLAVVVARRQRRRRSSRSC